MILVCFFLAYLFFELVHCQTWTTCYCENFNSAGFSSSNTCGLGTAWSQSAWDSTSGGATPPTIKAAGASPYDMEGSHYLELLPANKGVYECFLSRTFLTTGETVRLTFIHSTPGQNDNSGGNQDFLRIEWRTPPGTTPDSGTYTGSVTISPTGTNKQLEIVSLGSLTGIVEIRFSALITQNNEYYAIDDIKLEVADATCPVVPPTAAPTSSPTSQPTATPTRAPTSAPTSVPTAAPTSAPTTTPTAVTAAPTSSPTSVPTSQPSSQPTSSPTSLPTAAPTSVPTASPTFSPTSVPTQAPTSSPTSLPTSSPTAVPTTSPTSFPTSSPTAIPTTSPTSFPTASPTSVPTTSPTGATGAPTSAPSSAPTSQPSSQPTFAPTSTPTSQPTSTPTSVPTAAPTSVPTQAPSPPPSVAPTASPTDVPTASPTQAPTTVPTAFPSNPPTIAPTAGPTPTAPTPLPTGVPTSAPTATPTSLPTAVPTIVPTYVPTSVPTSAPTQAPTSAPTRAPTTVPTNAPSSPPTAVPTASPTAVTTAPTAAPTAVTTAPTAAPTSVPTIVLTAVPTSTPAPTDAGVIVPPGSLPDGTTGLTSSASVVGGGSTGTGNGNGNGDGVGRTDAMGNVIGGGGPANNQSGGDLPPWALAIAAVSGGCFLCLLLAILLVRTGVVKLPGADSKAGAKAGRGAAGAEAGASGEGSSSPKGAKNNAEYTVIPLVPMGQLSRSRSSRRKGQRSVKSPRVVGSPTHHDGQNAHSHLHHHHSHGHGHGHGHGDGDELQEIPAELAALSAVRSPGRGDMEMDEETVGKPAIIYSQLPNGNDLALAQLSSPPPSSLTSGQQQPVPLSADTEFQFMLTALGGGPILSPSRSGRRAGGKTPRSHRGGGKTPRNHHGGGKTPRNNNGGKTPRGGRKKPEEMAVAAAAASSSSPSMPDGAFTPRRRAVSKSKRGKKKKEAPVIPKLDPGDDPTRTLKMKKGAPLIPGPTPRTAVRSEVLRQCVQCGEGLLKPYSTCGQCGAKQVAKTDQAPADGPESQSKLAGSGKHPLSKLSGSGKQPLSPKPGAAADEDIEVGRPRKDSEYQKLPDFSEQEGKAGAGAAKAGGPVEYDAIPENLQEPNFDLPAMPHPDEFDVLLTGVEDLEPDAPAPDEFNDNEDLDNAFAELEELTNMTFDI